jgi:hypothetical protein
MATRLDIVAVSALLLALPTVEQNKFTLNIAHMLPEESLLTILEIAPSILEEFSDSMMPRAWDKVKDIRNVRKLLIDGSVTPGPECAALPQLQAPLTHLTSLTLQYIDLSMMQALPFIEKTTPLEHLTIDTTSLPASFYDDVFPQLLLKEVKFKDSIQVESVHFYTMRTDRMETVSLCGCPNAKPEVIYVLQQCPTLRDFNIGLTFMDPNTTGFLTSVSVPQLKRLGLGGMSDLDRPDFIFTYGSIYIVSVMMPNLGCLRLSDQTWVEWSTEATHRPISFPLLEELLVRTIPFSPLPYLTRRVPYLSFGV